MNGPRVGAGCNTVSGAETDEPTKFVVAACDAVMIVVPGATTVMLPDEVTVATEVLLEVYVNAASLVDDGVVTANVATPVSRSASENAPYVGVAFETARVPTT